MAHLVLPFEMVKERMELQRIMRPCRRGKRINRKLPYSERCHRPARFDNRKQKKLPPSIRANKQLELRVVKELFKLFPISAIHYELVMADVDRTSERKSARSGVGFSPVMVGQRQMLKWLSELAPVISHQGWQRNGNGTSQLKKWLGLPKDKKNKANQTPATHTVDGVTLAAFEFIQEKARKVFIGWCSGDTDKQVSVSGANWKRLGQFTAKKVQLLQRSTGLIVVPSPRPFKPNCIKRRGLTPLSLSTLLR